MKIYIQFEMEDQKHENLHTIWKINDQKHEHENVIWKIKKKIYMNMNMQPKKIDIQFENKHEHEVNMKIWRTKHIE